MKDPRIISFLPAATEMAYALGLGDALVGVSHECDFPPAVKTKPVVVRPALPLEKMSLREIDVEVAKRIGSGQSLYEVDEHLLRELKPDMILTQNLCQVCGPSGNEITVALKLLQPKPEIVWMTPHSLDDIFQNLRDLAAVTSRETQAEESVLAMKQRLQQISALVHGKPSPQKLDVPWDHEPRGENAAVAGESGPDVSGHALQDASRLQQSLPCAPASWSAPSPLALLPQDVQRVGSETGTPVQEARRRPRVFCLEWIDPCYCCGHWVPEMVELAGGEDALGRKGADSVRISWRDIATWAPEILIISPCGFNTQHAIAQANQLLRQPGWSELPAVRNGRVYAVNANAYFARPGPRVVDGVELLAHLIHPELCGWSGPADAFQKIETNRLQALPARAKVCPECGKSFTCGSQSGAGRCWCDEMPPLPPSALPESDCLCPACLERAVENARTQTA